MLHRMHISEKLRTCLTELDTRTLKQVAVPLQNLTCAGLDMGASSDLEAVVMSNSRPKCSRNIITMIVQSLAIPAGLQLSAGAVAWLEHSWPHAAQGQAVSAWTLRHRWLLWPNMEAGMRCNSSQGQTSAGDQQCHGPRRRILRLMLVNCL